MPSDKKKKKIEINIQCPTRWEDVTLDMMHQLSQVEKDEEGRFNVIDALPVLLGMTKEEVWLLPEEALDKIFDCLEFFNTPAPFADKASDTITIDGETYKATAAADWNVGQYIASDIAIKNDKNDYASLLAIICLREGEVYTQEYENKVLPQRIEMFKKVPVTDAMPLVSFFLANWIIRSEPSQASTTVEEELDRTIQAIQDSASSTGRSRRSTKAVKALQKLKKYL